MKKVLMTLACLLTLSFSTNPALAEKVLPDPNKSNVYITDEHLDVTDVISDEEYDYVLLSDEEVKKDSKASKISDDLKNKVKKDGMVLESLEIYKLTPKKNNSITEDCNCEPNTVSPLSHCNYGPAEYTTSATSYKPYSYNGQSVRQYLESWFNSYGPPSGHVENFYKSVSMETWWTRTSTSFTVKDASMWVDIQSIDWCKRTETRRFNVGSTWTPGWKTSIESYSWVWNTSSLDVAPVTTEGGVNYIQTLVKGDIYYGSTLRANDLTTAIEPNGL